MASEEELYISVDSDAYRKSKLNVLTNQLDLLNTLKRLQNLKVLSRRKEDLKKRVLRCISVIKNHLDSIDKAVPTPNIPRVVKKREEEIKEIKDPEAAAKVTHAAQKRAEIEDELLTIHEKLRQLNR